MDYLRYSLLTTRGVKELVLEGGSKFRWVLWSEEPEFIFVATNPDGIDHILVATNTIALRKFKAAAAYKFWRERFPDEGSVSLPFEYDPDFNYGPNGPAGATFADGRRTIPRDGS